VKVYLSGPMTGHSDDNRPAFARVAERWRARNHTVLSPAELPHDISRSEAMHVDFLLVLSCQGIVLLDGWQGSRGALAELVVAVECGLGVFDERGFVQAVYLSVLDDPVRGAALLRLRADPLERNIL
jgi:Domain of unknown function (DUF4406)